MRLPPAVVLALVMAGSTFGQTYTIYTAAGNGTLGFTGDNGPATSAELHGPYGVAADSAGNLYISDSGNNVIRKVSNGVITTFAGNGTPGYTGDNGPATGAQLNTPYGLAVDSAGNLYIADSVNNAIRKVSNGVITTVAGNGTCCYSGDNGSATSAQLFTPYAVAVDSAGNLYIADYGNNVVRKVSASNGVITTVAGNGTPSFGGDNLQATSAELDQPLAVAVDSNGNLYIADTANIRIRKVSNGVITTVAGGGTGCTQQTDPLGDGCPATSAELSEPAGLAVDSAGNLYIADVVNSRIRKVSNGTITTVAGSGTPGYTGDGGAATSAELNAPLSVALDSTGNIYIADFGNNRVRIMTSSSCTYSVGSTSLVAPASGAYFNVSIQTGASCQWAISGLPNWITVSGAFAGTGSGVVTLVVFPNNSGATLSATVLFAGVPVKVTQATATAALPPILAVTNAASFATGPVSPGEIVTLWGTGIGPSSPAYAATDPSTGKLATTIGGVQVLFNGIAAPMIYVGATQISAVVPYEMAPVSSPGVWIKYSGQTSNAFQLTSAATAPGLFTQNSSGSGPGSILNQDGITLNGPSHPAAKGSIVTVYMTGEGQTSPPGVTGAITTATLPAPQVTPAPVQPVVVQINGQPAPYVAYAGEAPGFVAGLMQLNVQIPSTAPSGNLSIAVSIGGKVSQNGVTVSVQ